MARNQGRIVSIANMTKRSWSIGGQKQVTPPNPFTQGAEPASAPLQPVTFSDSRKLYREVVHAKEKNAQEG